MNLAGGYRTYDGFDLESCTPELQAVDGLQAEPADDRPAPEHLLERLGHRRLRGLEEGRGPLLRRLPAPRGARLLLLRGDPARLHRLRLPARPDALHALAGGGLPALAPHERQRHLHLREVPARRDPRLRVRRARGAAARLAGVEPGGEAHGPPRLAGLRPRAPAAGRVRVPQREAAARKPERARPQPRHQRPVGPAGAEPDLTPDAHGRPPLRQLLRLRRRVEPQGRGRLHPRPGAPAARQLRPRLPPAVLRRALPEHAARSSSATPTSSRRSRTASPPATPSRGRRRRCRWTATTPR